MPEHTLQDSSDDDIARVTANRPALVMERALFLIFALQQMIVDSARLALPDH